MEGGLKTSGCSGKRDGHFRNGGGSPRSSEQRCDEARENRPEVSGDSVRKDGGGLRGRERSGWTDRCASRRRETHSDGGPEVRVAAKKPPTFQRGKRRKLNDAVVRSVVADPKNVL